DLAQPLLVLDADGALVEANRAARASPASDVTRKFERGADPMIARFVDDLQAAGRASLATSRWLLEGLGVGPWKVVVFHDRGRRARELASAVHDLNNLLTPILWLSTILERELRAGE